MKALCWFGKEDVRVETVPDPKIEASGDAIIKITSTAICGSDLHLYDGFTPTMESSDVLGHEPMGVVVEVGRDVKKLKVGDRVVVPFCKTGRFDPSFVITHRISLDDAPKAYNTFRDKEDGCIKVVIKF